ncbi:RhoGEF, variant 2 [Parelaphostrongylus tenuis]|uniref:RhoGEF, variant 2 n=1 Tax=Parelaphostrongylus tenuis TaxID=148309 RepID=A0AAD5MKH0_PARTN|nr:RhoGEF, variant 2 [Parelaphostrongylus tenuis]
MFSLVNRRKMVLNYGVKCESVKILLMTSFSFLQLYRTYCQNKAASDALRIQFSETSTFFEDCQRRACHPLPLGAYLLKPVQRITKYQLLLRELERHCRPEVRLDVTEALSTMLELLAQINATIQQLHISGFNGDLRLLGPLRLRSECDVYQFSRKKKGKLSRAQRRHLFLFDSGILFCKKRSLSNQPSSLDSEFYEHKMCIPMSSLGFSEHSRSGGLRFDLWDETKSDAYVIEMCDVEYRSRWIARLSNMAHCEDQQDQLVRQRPKSWTSTISNESTCSASTKGSDSEVPIDTNGNSKPSKTLSSSSNCLSEDITVDATVICVAPISELQSAEELVDSC